jgi:hypothetical protein
LWLEEYYWISDGTYVSLYPALMFAFLLLSWWNFCIPVAQKISGVGPSRIEWIALTSNAVLLGVVWLILWALWDWISYDNYRKYGTLPRHPQYTDYFPLDNRFFLRSPFGYESGGACVAEDRFVGVWQVLTPPVGDNDAIFSKLLIWRNQTYEKYDATDALVEKGYWNATHRPDSDEVMFQSIYRRGNFYEFWDRTFIGGDTEAQLILEPSRRSLFLANSYSRQIHLERIKQIYNSAPQDLGPRIVSPRPTDTQVRNKRPPLNPNAPFP